MTAALSILTLKKEPLLIPVIVQVIIAIAAVLKITSINGEDTELLTTMVIAAWGFVAGAIEIYKRSQITPTQKAVENVTKVLEAHGAKPENVQRAKETIEAGKPVYQPTVATDLPKTRYE